MSTAFDPLFRDAGELYRLDWRLLKAIARRESSFNPRAVNPRDPSYGIMQVSLTTARALGFQGPPEDLLDPLVGVTYGALALADIATRHRTTEHQAMVYNGGERGGRPRALIPGEMKPADAEAVKKYADDVMRFFREYGGMPTITAATAIDKVFPATPARGLDLRKLWPAIVTAALAFLLWRLAKGG